MVSYSTQAYMAYNRDFLIKIVEKFLEDRELSDIFFIVLRNNNHYSISIIILDNKTSQQVMILKHCYSLRTPSDYSYVAIYHVL